MDELLDWEDPQRSYHLESKLSQMCMITLAKRFWETEEIKTDIKNLFTFGEYYNARFDIRRRKKEEWYKITKKVLDYADVVTGKLPEVLKKELDNIIVYIGEEILSWREYLVCVLQLDVSFSDVIYLDIFGSIDESQIFQKYWIPNQESLGKSKVLQLACIFAQEDIIFESRNAIVDGMKNLLLKYYSEEAATEEIKKIKTQINKFVRKDDAVFALIVTWLNLNFEKEYLEFDDELQPVKVLDLQTREYRNVINEVKRNAVESCLLKHAMPLLKYFIQQELEGYNDCFEKLLERIHFLFVKRKSVERGLLDYEKKKYLEIIIFEMNSVSSGLKFRMFTCHFNTLLKLTLKYWPYQIFFFTIFNLAYDLRLIKTKSPNTWRKYLTQIAQTDRDDHLLGCPIKKNYYYLIFKDVWGRASKNVQTSLFSELVKINFESLNFQSVKLLVESLPESWDVSLLESKIKDWIKEENFFSINKFIEVIFDGFDKRQELKQTIKTKLMDDFTSKADISGLEKLLKWFSESEKERLRMKIEIDGIWAIKRMAKNWIQLNDRFRFAISNFLTGSYRNSDRDLGNDLGNEFLRWLYENDEEKIKYVKGHVSNDTSFCRDVIFSMFSNTFDARKLCTKFLEFIFDSEVGGINILKHALLKTEKDVLDFAVKCDEAISDRYEHFEIGGAAFPIKWLINFCDLTEREISELKTRCIDNIKNLMTDYTSKCRCYFMMDKLLNWLDENTERKQKDKFVTEFMNTPDGIKLCNIMFKAAVSSPKFYRIVLKFLYEWIKPYKNIAEIRDQVEFSNELTETYKRKLLLTLNKLQYGEKLKVDDISFITENNRNPEESESDYGSDSSESSDILD